MTEPSAPQPDREQLARAIGSLLWKDPERIRYAASKLRGTNAVIECRLRGGSMGRAIPAGAALRIDLGHAGPYRVGDVVAFVQAAGVCVHRVAYRGSNPRTADLMITQGDACHYPDPPISGSDVLGLVTAYRVNEDWQPATTVPAPDRATSPVGKALLRWISRLMELHPRLAQWAARMLRIRKEHAVATPV